MSGRSSALFYLLLSSLLLSGEGRNGTAVEEVIRLRERVVEEIAAQAEAIAWRQSSLDLGDDRATECTSELIFESCEEDCGQRLVNYEKTVVRTPFATNPTVLSGTLKQSICVSSALEEAFANVRTEYGLTNSWTYVGLRDGHFRTWPQRARGRDPESNDPYLDECKPFDPRRRPWYNAASTGPKDVVILVDHSASTIATSGSVGQFVSVWNVLQEAVLQIIDTFIYADYINVVLFASDAEQLWTDTPLAEGNNMTREILKQRVRQAQPSGSTNIVAGFEKATDLFIRGAEEGTTSDCNKVIILLSEGRDTQLRTSEILDRIERLQQRLERATSSRAHVFTYCFGQDSDESTSKQIACGNQGLWSVVRNFDNPLSDMNNYLEALATARGSQGAVWMFAYEDAGGLGTVSSVSAPFFSRGGPDELPILLGVAGHDVVLDDLAVGGYDSDSVLRKLVERSRNCQQLSLEPCDLQVRRFVADQNTQCVDVYPPHTCYQYANRWYRRFGIQRSQFHAQAFCRTLNGTLAPIRSENHLRFLSAISSADRSWIGGQRIVGSDPIKFQFEDPDIQEIDQYHTGWAINQPGELRQMCMTIDRRSTSGNLESSSCENVFDFICEFPDDLGCEGDTLRVTERNGHLRTFSMPYPPECPQMEGVMNENIPANEANELRSVDVICDFGPPVFHEELYCCGDCFNHSFPTSAAPNRPSPDITLLVFILMTLMCFL